MRDPRGRFVSEKTECPYDFWLAVCIYTLIFIFCFLYARQGFEYKQKAEIVLGDTTRYEIRLMRENTEFMSENMELKSKCQRAWTILHEDPRDGRKAYKVLDE